MRGSLSQSLSFSPRWLRVEVGGCPVGFSADLHILTESSTENTMRYGTLTTGVLVLLYPIVLIVFCFRFSFALFQLVLSRNNLSRDLGM